MLYWSSVFSGEMFRLHWLGYFSFAKRFGSDDSASAHFTGSVLILGHSCD
jgi:hypothetical protein